MKRRMLCLLCVVAMLASLLAGCGGGAADGGTTQDEQATPAPEAQSETPEAGTEAEAPVELSVFIDFTWFSTEEFTGIIPDEITKLTGVTLKPTKAVDDMQLGVLIASDDLPDLVYTANLSDRLSKSNVCYPYNELIEQYAPTFKPNDTQIMVAKSFATDGNYYTLLNAASPAEEWHAAKAGNPTVGSLLYRRDIVDDLGMEPMKTLDDYLNVLAAVKEKYPDMTPLTMEYSFPMDCFKGWIIPDWIPSTEQLLETADNKIIHVTSQPEHKEFLQFMNNMFLNGYINPDNFAFTDGTQSEELCNTNKAFSMAFMAGTADAVRTRELNNNGFEGVFEHSMPLSDLSYGTPGTGWAGVYISRKNTNPEASIKLMEWMFSQEGQKLTQWGREGHEYTLDADGVPQFSDEWVAASEDGTSTQIYNPSYYFGISGVTEAVGRGSNFTDNAKALAAEIRSDLRVVSVPRLVTPMGDSDEKIILDQIIEALKNGETKCILSASPEEFERNVDELYAQLDQIGLPRLLEYCNTQAQQYYN